VTGDIAMLANKIDRYMIEVTVEHTNGYDYHSAEPMEDPNGEWVRYEDIEPLLSIEEECLEEARLNGMGMEREARLLARLAESQAREAKLRNFVNICVELDDYLPETVLNALNEVKL